VDERLADRVRRAPRLERVDHRAQRLTRIGQLVDFSSDLSTLKEAAVIAGLQTIVLFVSDVERAARSS
jgi:hypothetical protein